MLEFQPLRLAAALLLSIPWMLSGCGSGNERQVVIGKVTGQVLLDGAPVKPGCVVTFLPVSAGADIGSGLVKENGNYVATSGAHDGLPIGDYRVIVSPPPLDPKEEEELTKKNSAAVMKALITKSRKELDKVEYPQDAIVPRKYWRDTSSGLTFKVIEGENKAPIELKSEKKK